MHRSKFSIPFNVPYLTGKETEYILESVKSGKISGDGLFTEKCSRFLEDELGVARALLTTSGTHALELASMLLGIGVGDEVIVPSYTFVSTANAFARTGAKPIFCDVRRDTLNMDEDLLEALITSRTRAVVPVHYGGVCCEMDRILGIAARHHLEVVEDNAHGLLGLYRGKPLGTFGSLAALSFHETKNVSCGEGGALLINDSSYIERAEVIREKGTNRSQFLRGGVEKYTWVDVGSSYLPSDILAAFLYAQLEALKDIHKRRRRIWESYLENIREWASAHGVQLPGAPGHCQQSYHLFYLLMPSRSLRDSLIAHLADRGILAVFHYQPLHLSEMGRRFGGREGMCPVSESVSERLVRLPFFNSLNEKDQGRVIDAVVTFSF